MLSSTLKQRLLALYPQGQSDVVDTADDTDFSHYVGVMADVLKNYGTDLADKLAQEVCPITAVDVLPTWEGALLLRGTKAALGSSTAARQSQLLSRLRERGPLTLGKIRAVLGPLLGYGDPSQLVIKTTSRSVLRTAHTYTGAPASQALNATIYFRVWDDALVSAAGAQVDVNLTTTALEGVSFLITPPARNGLSISPSNTYLGKGSVTGQTYRLFFPSVAGAFIADNSYAGGLWTLQVTGTGTLNSASLFVEGLGRDGVSGNGRGAAIFWWTALYEASKSTSAPDFSAARDAIMRIDHGTRRGSLCTAMTNGVLGLQPGDANALPGSIPGP